MTPAETIQELRERPIPGQSKYTYCVLIFRKEPRWVLEGDKKDSADFAEVKTCVPDFIVGEKVAEELVGILRSAGIEAGYRCHQRKAPHTRWPFWRLGYKPNLSTQRKEDWQNWVKSLGSIPEPDPV